MILSLAQLQSLARAVGFPDPALAAAVAMAESGGNTCAQGDPNINVHSCDGPNGTSTSFGLWQIHCATPSGAWDPACTTSPYDPVRLLQDPLYNARAAFALSGGTNYWGPWYTTMNTGSYKQWYQPGLPPAPLPPLPAPFIRPPIRARTGTGIAILSALAVAAAAGYVVHQELGRARQPSPLPPPLPFPT